MNSKADPKVISGRLSVHCLPHGALLKDISEQRTSMTTTKKTVREHLQLIIMIIQYLQLIFQAPSRDQKKSWDSHMYMKINNAENITF